MKALIYTAVETLEYRDAPQPVPIEGEELIQIMASGICGSDMHAYRGHDARRPAPLVLGHEAAGVVVGGPDEGRRVTINPLVTCGICRDCTTGRTNLCAARQIISMPPRAGAFADYVTMPRSNLITVPDATSLAHAALAEPLACGWHGVRLGIAATGRAPEDINALVIGGGAIGLGSALSLTAQGIRNVTLVEPNDERRAFLRNRCGQNAVAPDDLDTDMMFDLIIDGVGFSATRQSASAHARPGGVIVHIGLGEDAGGLDIRRMTLQEITFIGTYTYTADDFEQTAGAIFDGTMGPLDWIDLQPLSDGARAFKDIRAGTVAAPKTILVPAHARLP
jgi:threonine dehydrogenase-like Zn-dependent dehydrogenase